MITAAAKKGHIVQVIGSTFDIEFADNHLPAIYNAVKVDGDNKGVKIQLTGEVQQHLGGSRVRAVALGSTSISASMRGDVDVVDFHRRSRAGARSGTRRSAAFSTCLATPSTAAAQSAPRNIAQSINTRPSSTN